jgi:hypothetical protein
VIKLKEGEEKKSTTSAKNAVIILKRPNNKIGLLDVMIQLLAFVIALLISIKYYKKRAY